MLLVLPKQGRLEDRYDFCVRGDLHFFSSGFFFIGVNK